MNTQDDGAESGLDEDVFEFRLAVISGAILFLVAVITMFGY